MLRVPTIFCSALLDFIQHFRGLGSAGTAGSAGGAAPARRARAPLRAESGAVSPPLPESGASDWSAGAKHADEGGVSYQTFLRCVFGVPHRGRGWRAAAGVRVCAGRGGAGLGAGLGLGASGVRELEGGARRWGARRW